MRAISSSLWGAFFISAPKLNLSLSEPAITFPLRGRVNPSPENGSSGSQRFHAGQRLALEPFEEGAACSRYIGKAVRNASMVEGRHRIAAAGDGDELAFLGALGRMAGRRHSALIEGRDLEGAERTVPHQR